MKNLTIFDHLNSLVAEDILQDVAQKFGHSVELLKSNRRGDKLPKARCEAMHRLRTELKLSYPVIGQLLAKDHSTVIYALKKRERNSRAGGFAPVCNSGMSAAATANPPLQGSGRDNIKEVNNAS